MPETPAIESKSIDWVPLDERRGKPSTLFPLWFMSNANLTTLATGMVGAALGASLVTSLVAIVLGAAVGTVFTAFHSAQGPQLGLPQMIQSRAQFGYRGVVVICAVVVFSIVGFNVFNQILAADVLTLATGTDLRDLWFVLITACALTLAIYGYHWIHRFQTWLTWLFLATFGVFTVAALIWLDVPAGQFGFGGFTWAGFLVQFGAAAAYELGWAPYVSDYSRYLPTSQGGAKTFWFTLIGSCAGAILFMSLGAVVGVYALDSLSSDAIVYLSSLSPVGAPVIAIVLVLGMIGANCDNLYGPYLAGLSTVTQAGGPAHVSKVLRGAVTGAFGVLGTAIGIFLSGDFLTNLQNLILLLLYMLVPWTAINLVDFYLIHRGRYDVGAIVSMRGRYGLVNWKAIGTYAVAVIAQIPFMSCALFVGPVATALGGVDIAWLVGLFVAGILHYALNRSAAAEDGDLPVTPITATSAATATA